MEKSSLSELQINSLHTRWREIQEKVSASSIGKEVRVLAATKTVDVSIINYAIDHLGLSLIGENRVQELLSKYDALHKENLEIHFIGRLQTNKVKYIIDKVDMIESVDSLKLATEISRRAVTIGRVMDILVEMNIGREESKGGIFPEELDSFLESLKTLPGLRVAGLMVIPPKSKENETSEKYFLESYRIFLDILEKKLHNIGKPFILSMGMSDSYEEAIRCGADEVRLGSALFGQRVYIAQDQLKL